uniref:RNA polymerase II-associated protein 3 n=1 Tax=Strigamia maritima TaxID=126957 RepID=T1ILP0_STRMM
MDPLVQAQVNIRQNAEELQSFLRDLGQWKDEMTKKEKEIGQIGPLEQTLPAVRGSNGRNSKIETKDNDKVIKVEEKKAKRISSYDYKAWDNFDADKACEAIDDNKEKEDSEEDLSDEEEEEDIHEIRRKEEALQDKEKGNDYFRLGQIDSAIECYTQGMLSDPTNAFLPANRALALLKKEMYAAAEQDCDLAINIDKNYVKAYQRRGSARLAMHKLELAKQDFRKVLELEAGNKQAYDELIKIKRVTIIIEAAEREKNAELSRSKSTLLEEIKLKAEASIPKKITIEEITSEKPGLLKPITKLPHLRSKKPMKRLKIQEIVTKIKIPEHQIVEKKEPILNLELKSHEEALISEAIVVPASPHNLYQFQTSWKMLKKYKDKLYLYLKQIPCDQYVSIFDDFLEAEVVSDFLTILEQFYIVDDEDVYVPLLSLTGVKRFNILAMFFSDADKTSTAAEAFLSSGYVYLD